MGKGEADEAKMIAKQIDGDKPAEVQATGDGAKNELVSGASDVDAGAMEEYKSARKELRQAVKTEVKQETHEIARKLAKKVQQGDLRGTKMVLSLMEEKQKGGEERKKKKQKKASWARLRVLQEECEVARSKEAKEAAVRST